MKYETRKHDGSLPIIGVNTFLAETDEAEFTVELARSTTEEKDNQISRLKRFHETHSDQSEAALDAVKRAVSQGDNGFAELMDAVRVCSLGQLTDAFFEVGGQYRRNT